MRKLLVCLALLLASQEAKATCVGHLIDIASLPSRTSGTLNRDIADGRYEYGVGMSAWNLNCDAFFGKALQRPHRVLNAGAYSTWSPKNGASNLGIFAGPEFSDFNLGAPLQLAVDTLNLPRAWKPSLYLPVTISADFYVGFRPHPTDPDLRHNVPYGFLFLLSVPFGEEQVAAGL